LKGVAVSDDLAKDVTHLLFGKNKQFPEEWHQGFFYNPPNENNILQYLCKIVCRVDHGKDMDLYKRKQDRVEL
jgi:hypothetical protein